MRVTSIWAAALLGLGPSLGFGLSFATASLAQTESAATLNVHLSRVPDGYIFQDWTREFVTWHKDEITLTTGTVGAGQAIITYPYHYTHPLRLSAALSAEMKQPSSAIGFDAGPRNSSWGPMPTVCFFLAQTSVDYSQVFCMSHGGDFGNSWGFAKTQNILLTDLSRSEMAWFAPVYESEGVVIDHAFSLQLSVVKWKARTVQLAWTTEGRTAFTGMELDIGDDGTAILPVPDGKVTLSRDRADRTKTRVSYAPSQPLQPQPTPPSAAEQKPLATTAPGPSPAPIAEPTPASPPVEAAPKTQAEAARAAQKAGDKAGAVRLWRPLAEKGMMEAQYEMGVAYQYGNGVCRDEPMAIDWLQKAAGQGYAPAQRQLGELYYYAPGNPERRAQAESWMLKAALQGDVEAQEMMGDMNASGDPTPAQYRRAAYWYEKAAAQGSADAMAELGRLYRWGFGVTRDYAKAVAWYRKAAEKDSMEGERGLAEMYENGLGVAKNDTQAYTWYRLAGSNGYGGFNESGENVRRVKARLTPAQIDAAEAEVHRFRSLYPGVEWDGAIPTPPVINANSCRA